MADLPSKTMAAKTSLRYAKDIEPNSFEAEHHYYPRVLNASLHPMMVSFLSLGKKRIAERYIHLHPAANKEKLLEILSYKPSHFHWAGADLFTVTNEHGNRQMIVIETNSCPSGQKSMPSWEDSGTSGDTAYHRLLTQAFKGQMEKVDTLPDGALAVVYDKNPMEASGYAAAVADIFDEHVYLVEFYNNDDNPPVKWVDGVMFVKVKDDEWKPLRACFRYVTQKPWNRFPARTKTAVLNNIVACVAGGRNKLVAAKAYDLYNSELREFGLQIRTPETVTDVEKREVPLYVRSMGYFAVVKIPYSNAGQGVYTITCKAELDDFMNQESDYDKYIIQALVGNSKWSSKSAGGTYYHCGTIPNRKNNTFVADIRMMVGASDDGYVPIVVYSRRSRKPLVENLDESKNSWDMLGTNLSVKKEDGSWVTETNRLLLMDRKDFNQLGLGVDDLIDGYVQTVLSSIAIDKMCRRLDKKSGFDRELFATLVKDESLLEEMMEGDCWSKTDGKTTMTAKPQADEAGEMLRGR